ncbi:MAG: helix-turn-helix domain-containing protein [Clostridia bacterium]|nr:MAG: helix-turn-helix domain-containing protein [Clostridia bacterium]
MQEYRARVPWDRGLSLQDKAREIGVDFDRFIAGLARQATDTEMAAELDIPPEAVANLRRHFQHYGLHSVEGQD